MVCKSGIVGGLIFLLVIGSVPAEAQLDTAIVVQRNGIQAQFPYKKYRLRSELQNIKLPAYTTTKNNLIRLSAILNEYTRIESQYNALARQTQHSDSLSAAKEKTLQSTIELQKLRADNFEAEKDKILDQYNQLNGLLTTTVREAEKARKENWWRGAKQVGVPALAIGALVGILVTR